MLSFTMALYRRFNEAKHNLSVPEQVAAHPWPSVGIAFAVGALLGFTGGSKHAVVVQEKTIGGKVGEAVIGILGSLALKMVRDLAVKQFGGAAKKWWDQDELATRY